MAILNSGKTRVKFSAKNKKHLEAAHQFFKNSHWGGGCPFVLESEYISIPYMLADKIAKSFLEKKFEGRLRA